ncbi:MAG: hypothetical protein FWD58_01755 [Firmicutes bacterium]|nr:hypothetical protein [Bacillota bacterium]
MNNIPRYRSDAIDFKPSIIGCVYCAVKQRVCCYSWRYDLNDDYLSDGRTVIYFSFENGAKTFISKEETDIALAEKEKEPILTEGSGSVPTGLAHHKVFL